MSADVAWSACSGGACCLRPWLRIILSAESVSLSSWSEESDSSWTVTPSSAAASTGTAGYEEANNDFSKPPAVGLVLHSSLASSGSGTTGFRSFLPGFPRALVVSAFA